MTLKMKIQLKTQLKTVLNKVSSGDFLFPLNAKGLHLCAEVELRTEGLKGPAGLK